jgi:protein TonB
MERQKLGFFALTILAGCAGIQPTATKPGDQIALPRFASSPVGCHKYPAVSKRMGEQGTVVVKALIDTSGKATRIEVMSTSGRPRLDQAAVEYIECSKYVPGSVNGVPAVMWSEGPINFVLQ